MKGIIWVLALLALGMCGVFVVFDRQRTALPTPPPILIPTGLQGEFPIPEKEFKPVLDSAILVVQHRSAQGAALRSWGRTFGWVAIVCSALITLIAGFFGRPIKPDSQTPPTLDDVLGQQQQSALLVRAIGVVIALSTVCGLVSSRFEADAKTYAASAVELNKVVIKTTEILYDAQTTVSKARIALAELQGAMVQP
jgi:hypothetical protein